MKQPNRIPQMRTLVLIHIYHWTESWFCHVNVQKWRKGFFQIIIIISMYRKIPIHSVYSRQYYSNGNINIYYYVYIKIAIFQTLQGNFLFTFRKWALKTIPECKSMLTYYNSTQRFLCSSCSHYIDIKQ